MKITFIFTLMKSTFSVKHVIFVQFLLVLAAPKTFQNVLQTLPPFSLVRNFGKQNTHGNVSKISVSLACNCQIGSKSTNHTPIACRREGWKVTQVAGIGGFRSHLSLTRKTDGNFGNVFRSCFVFQSRVSAKTVVILESMLLQKTGLGKQTR